MSKLRADAPEFVPGSYKSDSSEWINLSEPTEDHITEEELAEIEACEAWVETLVEIEELENDHLVAFALSLAPEEKVREIQKRMLKPMKFRGHKGIHSSGMTRSGW